MLTQKYFRTLSKNSITGKNIARIFSKQEKNKQEFNSPAESISAKDKIEAFINLGRYKNQTGTLLLFGPCLWGTALGATLIGAPISATIASSSLFLFGAFNLRSAGCAINDMWDQDFDKNVERCKDRPLAAGLLSNKEAMLFTGAHLLGGLFVLS